MGEKKSVLRVLAGETVHPPPIWLMRQAGRYLPEYLETRSKADGFLDLCYTPDLACEVTLQPIRRFDFDAAILFSDILVIPDALKRDVRFIKGVGPQMTPIDAPAIAALDPDGVLDHLAPVMETVRCVREKLPDEKTLIGFCGAPWTVVTYMIAGQGTPDQAPARLFAYREPDSMRVLLDLLADISADYLIAQLEAGADVVQIFDSWAGVLDAEMFGNCAVRPVRRMVERVRRQRPDAKIIGFAKGAGPFLADYRQKTGVDAVGIDWAVPLDFAARIQKGGPIQGNLDPMRLVAGGAALDRGIDAILETLGAGPLIFNLGHGITPQVDPDNVGRLVARVRRSA